VFCFVLCFMVLNCSCDDFNIRNVAVIIAVVDHSLKPCCVYYKILMLL